MEISTTGATEEQLDNAPGVDYFNILPDELIIMIFSHLPRKHIELTRCGMVCRRWQRVSLDGNLWINANLAYRKIPLLTVARFIQRGLRTLEMESANIIDPDPWRRCFPKKYKSKLKVLDIGSVQISKRGLAHLLRPCHNLVHLNAVKADLTRQMCEAIGTNAQLEYLKLTEARGLDSAGLTAILHGCQNLKSLFLDNTLLSSAALNVLTSNVNCSLTSLGISNCSNVQDQHVYDLLDRCQNLRFLDLTSNYNITEAAIARGQDFINLQLLHDRSIFDEDFANGVIDLNFHDDDDEDYDDFGFDDEDDEDYDDFGFDDEDDEDDFFFDHDEDDEAFLFEPMEESDDVESDDDDMIGVHVHDVNEENDVFVDVDDVGLEIGIFGEDSDEEDENGPLGSNEGSASSHESDNMNNSYNSEDGDNFEDVQSSGSNDSNEIVVIHYDTDDSDVEDEDLVSFDEADNDHGDEESNDGDGADVVSNDGDDDYVSDS